MDKSKEIITYCQQLLEYRDSAMKIFPKWVAQEGVQKTQRKEQTKFATFQSNLGHKERRALGACCVMENSKFADGQ